MEQDVIRQSFSVGNHTWIKQSLPTDLSPDAINRLRRQRMERNRLAEPQTSKVHVAPVSDDRKFEPVAPQSVPREKFSPHWRHNSQEKRMKHEAMIERPGQKVHPYSYRGETIRRRQVREEEGFPYLGGPKELELPQTQDWTFLRSKVPLHDWTTAPQVAPSPTFLGGRGHGLEDDSRTSRMTLPMMREELQHRLCSDWPGLRVVVSCTPQDLIQVAFDLNTADSERALLGYMNVLAKEADFLCTRGLRKVSQLWGVRRLVDELGQGAQQNVNEWLLFLLTPKWVRMRPTDAYYTVHPRSSGSVFKMSAVGLSVMTSRDSDTVNEVRVRPSPGSVTRADKLDLLLLEKAASSLSTENSRQECPLQPGQGALPSLKKKN